MILEYMCIYSRSGEVFLQLYGTESDDRKCVRIAEDGSSTSRYIRLKGHLQVKLEAGILSVYIALALFDELRRPIFMLNLLPFADRFPEVFVMADESVVVRRVIPSDNSCLFNAVG